MAVFKTVGLRELVRLFYRVSYRSTIGCMAVDTKLHGAVGRFLLLLVLSFAAACTGSGAQVVTSGQPTAEPATTGNRFGAEGLIAFSANGDIYAVNPSGKQLRQVTHGSPEDFSPSWFPAGDRVAFRREQGGPSAIYQANLDGAGLRKANLPQDAEGLVWSPDGRLLAYSGGAPGETDSKGDVLIAKGDGSEVRLAAGWPDSTEEYPAWSPDGRKIVFSSNHALSSDEVRVLWVVDLETSHISRLTTPAEKPYLSTDVHPTWSPDGKSIAFQTNRGGGEQSASIWVIRADGSNLRQLTSAVGEFPSWSPDGARIAFNGSSGITIVGKDGQGATTIASKLGYTPFVAWWGHRLSVALRRVPSTPSGAASGAQRHGSPGKGREAV